MAKHKKRHKLYDRNWGKIRNAHLTRNPLCVFCLAIGKTTPATVVDHIVPHKGDEELFYDENNFQSLCKLCHDSAKKIKEEKGIIPGCDEHGFPIDKSHPWYDND